MKEVNRHLRNVLISRRLLQIEVLLVLLGASGIYGDGNGECERL